MLDPRGSGLLSTIFHVYKALRPQPYTCLGIEWLTTQGVKGEWSTIFHVYKAPTLHLWELNDTWTMEYCYRRVRCAGASKKVKTWSHSDFRSGLTSGLTWNCGSPLRLL